jgi:hypothetical protein
MKTFLTLALAAAFCAPAFAQQSGMINRNAPTIKQSITVGDTKMSLDYTSLNYGEGKAVGQIMDKANAEARKRLNEGAPKKPLAKFSTSVDVKVGDATLAAGDYDVFFTVNDDTTMNINFRMGDKVTTSKLALMPDAGHQHKMLVMSLYAGDNGGAGVFLGFGNMSGMLTIAPAKAAGNGK